jgi:hypothetical protein
MSEKTSTKSTKSTKKKSSTKSKGLGDTVEKITEATGIKKAVEMFAEATGIDCGCDERKKKLNALFPYKHTECLLEHEHEFLGEFYAQFDGVKVNEKYTRPLAEIHARVFNHKFDIPCSCSPKTWKAWINDLRKVYDEYKKV